MLRVGGGDWRRGGDGLISGEWSEELSLTIFWREWAVESHYRDLYNSINRSTWLLWLVMNLCWHRAADYWYDKHFEIMVSVLQRIVTISCYGQETIQVDDPSLDVLEPFHSPYFGLLIVRLWILQYNFREYQVIMLQEVKSMFVLLADDRFQLA